jgi:long-chain fatty acid transport protein
MRKLSILALLLPAVSLANGYDVPNTSPRDLAMAGSVTAAQLDAAAAYANPAALSKVEGLNINGALGILDLRTRWSGEESLAGESARTRFKPAPPVSVFAAYGWKLLDRNLGVGLGMNVPAGGNVFYPSDWAGRGRIITVDRKIYGFYLTGGYEVLPQLRVGGGLVYYYGTEYLKQGVQPSNQAFGELSTRGGAPSFDLSAEYTLPQLPLSFGADFKYKATLKMSGHGHFEVPAGGIPGNEADSLDQGVKHHLTYPSILNVGVAYRVMKPWLATFGYTWTDYSVYREDLFQGDTTTIVVPRHYRDGHTFRLGSEYDLTPTWKLRAGILRDVSGLRTSTYSPTLPDASSWAFALGAGWNVIPDLDVQGSFFYAVMDKVTATDTSAEGGPLPGSYDTHVWIASFGAVWRMDLGGGR